MGAESQKDMPQPRSIFIHSTVSLLRRSIFAAGLRRSLCLFIQEGWCAVCEQYDCPCQQDACPEYTEDYAECEYDAECEEYAEDEAYDYDAESIDYSAYAGEDTTESTAVAYAAAPAAEDLRALMEKPGVLMAVIALVFGFLLGASLNSRSNAGCPFCKRPGEIGGFYKNGDMNKEKKPAVYCPMCGKKLH